MNDGLGCAAAVPHVRGGRIQSADGRSFRPRLVVSFDRSNIDECAPASLAGFNLASADQSRQTALADGKKGGGGARRKSEWFKSGRHSWPLNRREAHCCDTAWSRAGCSGLRVPTKWAMRRRAEHTIHRARDWTCPTPWWPVSIDGRAASQPVRLRQ